MADVVAALRNQIEGNFPPGMRHTLAVMKVADWLERHFTRGAYTPEQMVGALREQIDAGKKGTDRMLRGSVEQLACIGVAHWIEQHFLGDPSSSSSPTE